MQNSVKIAFFASNRVWCIGISLIDYRKHKEYDIDKIFFHPAWFGVKTSKSQVY